MNFFELIERRESCRSYAKTLVEKEKLVACIEAARIAPSANNSQPWHFTVINSPELVPKVAKLTQSMGMNRFTDTAPAFVVLSEDRSLIPAARKVAAAKRFDFTPIDIGLATSQLCLAATEQGLSTCILGWFNEGGLKKLLNIRTRIRLVAAIGYSESDTLRPKKRRTLNEAMDYIG